VVVERHFRVGWLLVVWCGDFVFYFGWGKGGEVVR